MTQDTNNLEIVKRFYRVVWNGKNPEMASEFLDEVVVIHLEHTELVGIDGWRRGLFDPFVQSISGGKVVVEDIIVANDKVISRWKVTGRHSGELFGVAPSGETVVLTGMTWFTLARGKIVEMRNNWNVSYFLKKLSEEVASLRNLIPICLYCKNIRNDEGFWEAVEAYFAAHTNTRFSHGVCPVCRPKAFEDLGIEPPG